MPTLSSWRRRLIRYEFLAEVVRVVDGDTVDCRIDLGFDPEQTTKRFRLLGINAPEPRGDTRAPGEAATAHLDHLIRASKLGELDGHPVLFVRSHKNERDGFSRYIFELFGVEADGALFNINLQMVSDGHAQPAQGWNQMTPSPVL